ncbi:energy transducer TonB [Flexithrix dorotheae]|uniref:energy transducer TonB n=1 Tax=Flexithrix dorotheae TaxID=70993 RepID=UPI00036B3732|nr:energy transducer TonB [Flexithrix dorotheae]
MALRLHFGIIALLLICLGNAVSAQENTFASNKKTDGFKPKQTLNKSFANSAWLVNYSEIKRNIAYPEACRKMGIEGTVILAVFISADGRLKERKVVKSPHQKMSEECLRQVKYMHLLPAKDIHGNTYDSWIYIPVKFHLAF